MSDHAEGAMAGVGRRGTGLISLCERFPSGAPGARDMMVLFISLHFGTYLLLFRPHRLLFPPRRQRSRKCHLPSSEPSDTAIFLLRKSRFVCTHEIRQSLRSGWSGY